MFIVTLTTIFKFSLPYLYYFLGSVPVEISFKIDSIVTTNRVLQSSAEPLTPLLNTHSRRKEGEENKGKAGTHCILR